MRVAKKRNRLVNLGFDSVVFVDKVVAVTASGPKPIKRLINEARRTNKLVDATSGRKTRSVVITDSGHVILSANEPGTLAQRIDET